MKKHLPRMMVLVFFSTFASALSGQSISESLLLPPAPESAALIRSITHPAALWCGGADITVPLYQASSRSVGVEMALHYQSSGNKVHDIAGSTGLGWRFSAGGRITRIVRGLPGELTSSFGDYGAGADWGAQAFGDWLDGTLDNEPDLYFYEFGGRKGIFVFDEDGEIFTLPYQPLRIEWVEGHFRITDESGCLYTFGLSARDVTTARLNGQNIYAAPYTSTWYLERILSPSGDCMELDYYQESNLSHGFTERYFMYSFPSASTWQQSGTQTSEYELLHTQYCGNLKSISWRGGRVECLYSAQSGGSPLSKLDEIKIYSMQNEHRYSLHFNYGNFVGANSAWQPLKLLSVERRGATDRLLLARFDYHETWALPHRDSYDTDHWGYYNRANNLSHCPLFAYNGTECSGANRTPSLEAARSGMLKRVYSVYGGFSEYDYELNTTAAGASGGLRISSIRQAAEENDPGQITRFRYVTAGGNASSGQSLRSVGDYACGGSTGFAVVASRNRYECMDVAGFTTGYSRVEELLPNGSYRVYNYAFNGGIDPEVYAIPSGSTVAQNATFFPVALRFGEQGMLSSCVSYDAEGSEVARESYTYPAAPQSRAIISGNAPVQIQGPATEGTFRYAGRYIWVSRSILPASVTVSGDDTPGYTTTIMRDNDTCLPLETVTTTAAGDTYITQTRYPFQYDVSDVPASASDANAIRTMQENHMLSVPVEEVVYKNGRVTDGSLNTYRVIETTHSARSIVPASQRVLKLAASLAAFTPASFAANGALSCDAAYKPVMWFDYYDVWGNLLQYHEEEGKPISFVYGYDNSVAIAQITGAEARDGRVNGRENEVFYTSFEDDPLAETIDAKSGRKARRGPIVIPSDGFKQSVAYHTTWQMNYISGRSQLISTSYTTQAKYIVTWWGSLDGGKTWEPYRSTISILPVDGFTVGTAAHYVDEVSIIPENASITTSTWIPGVGKTSEGTGNGYTTYYRYDAFGRPVHILDNRKEETHSYKYQ